MRIQLLQDIDDSGAAPSVHDGRVAPPHGPPPPPARARPAVWHRAPPGALTSLPPSSPVPVPEPAPAPVPSADPAASDREPDWLLDLIQQDAQQADARQKAVRTRRRVFGWSIGPAVMVLAVAAVWWAVEERRVDDALVVVSENKLPGPTPAPTPATPAVLSPPPAAASSPADAAPPAATPPAAPSAEDSRQDRAASRVTAAKAAPENGPAGRRKREETLLQCRALGYDERQCIRRGCEMTRFGLACRGGASLTTQ